MTEIHISYLQKTLNIPASQIRQVAKLLSEGATIPFIARYRKEATGSLDEVQLADIDKGLKKLADLEKRRETILSAIEEQGKLTPALESAIRKTMDTAELEDLYLPYKQKRKTRATIARDKGLEPLAKSIWAQVNDDPAVLAKAYIQEEVPTVEEALQGARDIIAERINEDQIARNRMRQLYSREAILYSKVARGKDEEAAKYRDYFDFTEALKKCPSHRLLAIRRGEAEGLLRVRISPEEEEAVWQLKKLYCNKDNLCTRQLEEAIADSFKRLLGPAIETEFRQSSKEKADEEAILVFAENLRQLLLAAPLGQKKTLAIDPGFRTGCKIVVLDDNGDLLKHTTIFPHPPQNQAAEALRTLEDLIQKYQIEAIAVGNGTAGRESMQLLRNASFASEVEVFQVNESGASIYSASEIAREEFPDHDLTIRGSVSIGRRLMDPLAELVKLDAKSIGVGQYQHDVNQGQLKESLDRTVESCVNSVGINLNTASKHLLTYVSGLGPTLAANIIEYRSKVGQFHSREELKSVSRLGEKAFEQAAGFLRIREAPNPLDNTAVHPERYSLVKQMAADLGCSIPDLIRDKKLRDQIRLEKYVGPAIGLPTLKDILQELNKPGLDPRGKAKSFEFSEGVYTMEDLRPGMILNGIVTNITNFGAFVDIGVKQDGLVHVSQMADRFVKNPVDVVSLQQEVKVRVVEVDLPRKRITLSMKSQ
ncbi:MAG: RNA-binding transcriptional accessory protein [Saprospiraceae bacterium]|nr:RNA-binding transcriptional accessory protein [Saprospiraceae bacterium]